ncbi:MAG: hypothetical protein QHJ82_11820 [Verrucomicrobiota bacterium]|nr:hypothetical protein [Verrucomicrobiota bacterium]
MRQWIKADKTGRRKPQQHPLWPEWTIWQYRVAASFMEELHALANQIAGRRVPMGANAGLLWAGHLSDYKALDLFSAETDHHAPARGFSLTCRCLRIGSRKPLTVHMRRQRAAVIGHL